MKRSTASRLRFLMNLYPPLFFNSVRLLSLSEDYTRARIRIRKTFLNTNMNGTIFGGTLALAADPYHGVMYWNILARRGVKMQVWVRASEMDYRKAATESLYTDIHITEKEIQEVIDTLYAKGKITKPVFFEMKKADGTLCASAKIILYIRRLPEGQSELLGF